jgi:hypothetical protein
VIVTPPLANPLPVQQRSTRLRPWALIPGAVGVGAGVASALFLVRVAEVVGPFNGDGKNFGAEETSRLRVRGTREEIAGFGFRAASLASLVLATVFWRVGAS